MKLNIQLFASGTITGSSTASIGRVQILWSSTSKGAVENKSDVTATVQVKRSTAYNTTGTFSGTLWINGVAFSIKKKFDPISNQWKTIDTKTLENVEHNADGSKTIEIKTSFSNTGTSMAGTYTASANVQLDTIARASLFYSCSVRVNSDSTLTLYHNISKQNTSFTDKLTFCGQEFTIPNGSSSTTIARNSTAWTTFYNTMGTAMYYTNYSATLRTYNGTTQIGEDNTISYITGSLNKLDNVDNRTYAINTSSITATDNNASSKITSTNADGSTYQSTHSVSEFTSGTTFLQGWSNPKLASTISVDTAGSDNYTFGRPIVLSGISTNSITLDGNSYTENVYLGTGFSADTYKLNATDGRKSATEKSISISQKSWTRPSVKITLTRQSATSQYVDWQVSWSYTSVSRTNGNLNATLYASYTYNGNTTTLVNITSGLATSGTRSGTITLAGEDDYKYSITGNATLVDMIDYKVHSSDYKPAGQPALYVHKDSSSNNVVDVLGTLAVDKIDYNKGLYFKEDGYGDKFRIIPYFNGADDVNTLKIQGAVGGAGTDPSEYDLMTITGKNGHITAKGSFRIPANSNNGYGLTDHNGTSIIKDWDNGTITMNATGGTLYLGHQTTGSINFLDGNGTWDASGLRVGNSKHYCSSFDLIQSGGGYVRLCRVASPSIGSLGNLYLKVFTGDGWNGRPEQNTMVTAHIKKSYDEMGSALWYGCTYSVYGCNYADDRVRIHIRATSIHYLDIYLYSPYWYSSGRFELEGQFDSVSNVNDWRSASTPTDGTEQQSNGGLVQMSKTLYDNSSGTNGDVYLSETSANFKYIDIQFRSNDGENFVNSQRIYDPNGKYTTLFCSYTGDNNGTLYLKARVVYINGTSIITQATNRYSEASIKTSSASASKVNNIYITKVMGYR